MEKTTLRATEENVDRKRVTHGSTRCLRLWHAAMADSDSGDSWAPKQKRKVAADWGESSDSDEGLAPRRRRGGPKKRAAPKKKGAKRTGDGSADSSDGEGQGGGRAERSRSDRDQAQANKELRGDPEKPRALIIEAKWAALILHRKKTAEMRSTPAGTMVGQTVGIAVKGTNRTRSCTPSALGQGRKRALIDCKLIGALSRLYRSKP